METERVHNLIEEGHSEQRICFMNDKSFSQSSSSEPNTEELFAKYSPSKAMLVGDCLKRALATDRKLAVPPKKRKQTPQELDLCDAFIDQNLQKSELNRDLTFCQKFRKENISTSSSSASEKGTEERSSLSSRESCLLLYPPTLNMGYHKWILLRSNSATIFAGGPIQSSAFSIMSHDTKGNQYVAVAAGNAIDKKHSCNNTKNLSGIIQFWNVGSLHERKKLNQLPSMELALYHDNGIITQMKWCPADCYDKHPSTCNFPRLGLLAASSSDSYVYIYSVPHPDFMPKLKSTFPIYFTQPFMKLLPLFGGHSYLTRKAVATCIEWQKNGERIVAGYGNGAVCVWMIKVSSFASNIAVKNIKQSYIIQPYLFFQASGASIADLSFAPFNNHRWLVVSSIDKIIRFFDLHDTSAPFHVVKQGLENSCIWSNAFCGVYSSPAVNSMGLISLSAKDSCAESNDRGVQKGLFDSSTYVAASENKNLHAVADMAGRVTVNFLQKYHKPLETSYLTYMIFETEIMALAGLDQELKISGCKISISVNIPSNDITSDTKDTFYTKIKQGSSSSSGFCSPNNDKTIVIETTQCFDDDVKLLKSPLGSSSMNDFKDITNKGVKQFLNKQLHYSDEETNDEMMKSSGFSEDLMRDLLMVKISNLTKISSHILPYNSSCNSAYCDSKGAKQLSEKALITTPAATDYSGDTILYPFEPCFCDTSHPNAVKSNSQSKSLDLNGKANTLYKTTVYKQNGEPTLKTEMFTENNLHFSASVESGNSHPIEDSSSNNWCEPNVENCGLNYKSRNLKKSNYLNYDCNSFHLNGYQFTSTHSDLPREECHVSKTFPKEIMKNGDTLFQNLDTKGDFICKKDAIQLSSCESFDNSLCNVLKSSNLNQPKSLPDMYSSTTSNNFIVCDKDDQQISDRALIQSSAVSDYSGDTVIYYLESHNCNKTDADSLKLEKPGATFQSLYKSEKINTFQDTLLLKVDEKEVVIHESETKLLTERCSSFAREKCEHFFTKESLKYNSGYETNSATRSYNSSDEDRNFLPKDFQISDFQLLHSEYVSENIEEKYTKLIENPQELSYENLIANFGVVFKNNLNKSIDLLKHQENDINIEYNPLSVIKTISWDPNEGCQSWLFIGGNSGIGQLVFVPDFIADKEKKPRPIHKKRVLT
ncbi:unnamed protein product [Larinioides sclopetarius]|uniref:Uncharacterized protein n=1 Tax=Larinioides sclopetarius TaxID=280406 RepID=A0AAV1Z194_9ARAC